MTSTTPKNCPTKDVEKVTPGGTKLPEGPPPIEKGEREPTPPPMTPVPPLPCGSYEVYNEAGVSKWLGPQAVQMESMHDGGDLQGFWNSRRGGIQQVPDPEVERVQRLEQELKDFREALTMRQVQGQDPLGACSAQPFQRMGPPTANPGMTQWNINQACQDVNRRDWIHVNAGQPNLPHRGNQTAGNLCGSCRRRQKSPKLIKKNHQEERWS